MMKCLSKAGFTGSLGTPINMDTSFRHTKPPSTNSRSLHFENSEAELTPRAAKRSSNDYWSNSAETLPHSNVSNNVPILLAVLCSLPAPLQETHPMWHVKTTWMALRRMERCRSGVSEQNQKWRCLHTRGDEEVQGLPLKLKAKNWQGGRAERFGDDSASWTAVTIWSYGEGRFWWHFCEVLPECWHLIGL
jgi:hypothetical protein